jgi:hypothetical protein
MYCPLTWRQTTLFQTFCGSTPNIESVSCLTCIVRLLSNATPSQVWGTFCTSMSFPGALGPTSKPLHYACYGRDTTIGNPLAIWSNTAETSRAFSGCESLASLSWPRLDHLRIPSPHFCAGTAQSSNPPLLLQRPCSLRVSKQRIFTRKRPIDRVC